MSPAPRRPTLRRSFGAALVAACLLLVPATASAALLWTLVGVALSGQTHQVGDFTLTATNADLLSDIGCITVDTTSRFEIRSTSIDSAPSGSEWGSSFSGTLVIVQAEDGGDRLDTLESVTFTVRAVPLVAGLWNWSGQAYKDEECRGSSLGLALVEVLVTEGPTPTPSPTPTPTPTPSPTPLLPLPTVSLTPLPTLDILATPTPTPTRTPTPPGSARPAPTRTPAPAAATSGAPDATPSATPSPTATPASAATAPTPSPAVGTEGPVQPGSGAAFALVDDGDALDLGIDILGTLDGIEVWFVPAAVVGAPGLLVVVWVALQALGGIVWLPAVRRMLGDDEPQTRRRL